MLVCVNVGGGVGFQGSYVDQCIIQDVNPTCLSGLVGSILTCLNDNQLSKNNNKVDFSIVTVGKKTSENVCMN